MATESVLQEHRIVVGLDYGTTYSGTAHGDTSQKSIDNIKVIRRWPGKERRDEVKCPSDIAYGADGTYRWGYLIPPGLARLAWAKLDLDEDNFYENQEENPEEYVDLQDPFAETSVPAEDEFPMAEGMRHNPLNKSPVDVVADYLTALYDVIMSNLRRAQGENFINRTAIDWVMTVPAVWSEKAQALTKEAASRAGIGQREKDRLFLLSEPEAAAVYAISELYQRDNTRRNDPNMLNVGDTFVLCDAGGGTVDLISYKVGQLQPSLGLSEVAVGSGAKCGSTFVDRNLLKLVRKKIGDDRFQILCQKQDGMVLNKMVSEFEGVKRSFGASYVPGSVSYLPMHGFANDPAAGIIEGQFELTHDDLKECFDPIMEQIIDLIQGQIDAICDTGSIPKYVFLVGGFGESDYLLNRLSTHKFGKAGQVEIINPDDAWSAVSRGAVLRGLEGSLVTNRRCRRNYGTRINTVFDPTIHHEEDAFYSTDTGMKMARNQVSWIVEKGADTDSNTRFKLKCGTTFQKGEKLRRGATLVASDLDIAPHSYRDKSVHDLCFLMADLSMVPESEFDSVNINGQACLSAEFTIEMAFESAEIKFQLYFKDNCYGQVKTTFH
ncbi:hypothetical protein TWF225_009592 [Orbilia oligospora]|uniref:Uncharacterized protein n=1 Tax=Orbilia oligospora TaxID=2813651 RepID=A0A7C8K5R5_ORBOL|nr:hypothetical protein TWF751_010798 [Orbilia oligospora]KAF3174169.1 hypothetical protein TWF225_009592 [Orbilia oligospora]KAF3249841.1 hypothetical protein TWF217_008748 [Orbilia oligospora]KAF3259345.1 hypothetical protein TWF128_004412 [Orbilia oligospora]TGJ68793.1 hypothetical protein EYR41_004878 [Orbilia oligospora]